MTSIASIVNLSLPLQQQDLSNDPLNLSTNCKEKERTSQSIVSDRPKTSIPSAIASIPKKPMRPLTAYHIFFQIEREYIIQTTAGEDADKSIHDNKVYLDDVPLRYTTIKLSPDWYFGPGKRQKRKHRKQHGKIGFLELSRVISTRWAQLAEVDPDTKTFVQKIAKGELDEYYREMKKYKELTKDPTLSSKESVVRPHLPKKKKAKKQISSIRASRLLPSQQDQKRNTVTSYPDMPTSSSYQAIEYIDMPPASIQFQNDIDYFFSCIDNDKTQNDVIPENQALLKRKIFQTSPSSHDLSGVACYYDDDVNSKPTKKQRTTSSTPSCHSPTTVEVDICDDEILQLWKSHN